MGHRIRFLQVAGMRGNVPVRRVCVLLEGSSSGFLLTNMTFCSLSALSMIMIRFKLTNMLSRLLFPLFHGPVVALCYRIAWCQSIIARRGIPLADPVLDPELELKWQ